MKRVWAAIVLAMLAGPVLAAERYITLASTTSTQNSGLLDTILPIFLKHSGIHVRVIAVGTGQALRIARNGDADALLVHHRPSEDAFVAEGFGLNRQDVMYNDFVIIGPSDDPANVAQQPDAIAAFQAIEALGHAFASRGDDSGTHKKEQELWRAAGVKPTGDWYLETGSGMGATLNFSVSKQTYTLADRGTWITFGNKQENKILFSGDAALFNPYGIIQVNPTLHPHTKSKAALLFANWLVSPAGQAAISDFRTNGMQAFCPNAMGLRADIADRAACPSPSQ